MQRIEIEQFAVCHGSAYAPGANDLAGIDKPVLVVHGTADRVIEPSSAEHALGKIPGAVGRWFVDGGHAPFAESAAEFDAVLRQFAEEC